MITEEGGMLNPPRLSRPFRPQGLWGSLTQGVGLRPRPWAISPGPLGRTPVSAGKYTFDGKQVSDLVGWSAEAFAAMWAEGVL